MTPKDRAGTLVARWRTTWGKWVDHWSRYCPGKTQRQVHADVPGILTRLKLASDIEKVIEEALEQRDLEWEAAWDKHCKRHGERVAIKRKR